MDKELLRALPKVDELLKVYDFETIKEESNRENMVNAFRKSIDYYRKSILDGNINKSVTTEDIVKKAEDYIEKQKSMKLKRVVNGTGVIIHTNLGRSLLSDNSIKAINTVAKYYNNLEYNLEKGSRGSRYDHIEMLINKITGAEAALVVNNNAAAIMIALNTICKEKEVIISRGQLVEIGGSFRIPDVMEFAGANLVEVGTTNRTHLYDYEKSINENTGALLKVHSSNFKMVGFTKEVSNLDLVNLSKKYNIPTIEDIGSGTLIKLSKYGLEDEKTVQESIKAGVDIVTFSGDKMLGGPQAGIIVGKKQYIDKIKKNQLARALRVDKFTLAALEATLKHYLNEEEAIREIPTLNMMTKDNINLKLDAQKLKRKLNSLKEDFDIKLDKGDSTVGGGSMPSSKISTYLIKIKSKVLTENELERALRMYKTPIITRVYKGQVCLDIRTLLKEDYNIIYEALKEIGDNI